MSVKKEQFAVQVPVQASQMLINVIVRSRISERFFISKILIIIIKWKSN